MSHDAVDTQSLYVRDGADYRRATAQELMKALNRFISNRVRKGSSMESPHAVRAYLRMQLSQLEYEMFCMLALDNRHRLIAYLPLFRGTIDGAAVHPREVVKEALRYNAAAVIFVHNHPSGIAEASNADKLITQRLREALGLIDIRVLDHLIIASDQAVSFAELGLL